MTESEAERIRVRYLRVRSFEDRMKHAGFRRMLVERDEALKRLLLGPLPKPLRDCRILDFGCGDGYTMNFLHSRGASPELISGCDIRKDVLVAARALYPEFDFFESDGTKLPFADGEIDLITCYTVFSSILDPNLQERIGQELTRVLSKSGCMIWYDLRWPSPNNRAMTMSRIRTTFPQLVPELKSRTLLPPIAERLGLLTDVLYPILASMPPLRSHYFGTLHPQEPKMQDTLSISLAKFNQRQGPRVGDYVVTLDGVYRRIACDWGYEMQTGLEATFHLSDRNEGHMNFCGRLDLVIPRNNLAETSETKPGTCLFQQQEVPVFFRVWRANSAYRLSFKRPPLQRAMVIELFGAPAVGKTTIAEIFATALKREGYGVHGESGKRQHLLSRSLLRGAQSLWSLSPRAPQNSLASSLMTLLPPRNPLWVMRLRGYLGQLCGVSDNGSDVIVFDQGFVQFICSLILLSGVTDRDRIAEALALIPMPDLVIRVEAPPSLVEERLLKRQAHLSTIQRWLELDFKTSMHQADIIALVSEILPRPPLTINYTDKDSSAAIIEIMLSEVRSHKKFEDRISKQLVNG